jgi:hypothetical protein
MIPLTTLSLVILTRLTLNKWIESTRYPLLFTSSLVAMSLGMIISVSWIMLMKNHALQPGHWVFLPRHFIALFYSCILVGAIELRALADVGLTLVNKLASSRRCRPLASASESSDTAAKAISG